MTRSEFQELAARARIRESPSLKASRLVLLGGMRSVDAAKEVGATSQSVNNTLKKLKDVQRALNSQKPPEEI